MPEIPNGAIMANFKINHHNKPQHLPTTQLQKKAGITPLISPLK
ncbi:MAG: hypothetical protein NTX38_16685 [Methylobacter sp.]|nr:hypothetical protein [Methylobacter sp.]